jgi:hypothetical protein
MEQKLLEDLIIESISIFGMDVYYIPRTIVNKDELLDADDQSLYENAFNICMYLESFDKFGGKDSYISKLAGLTIDDQVTFAVARRIFDENVSNITTQIRPNEGDLIYFPLNDKCFQITFVDKFEMFYQLGSLYTWKMQCSLFQYSSEIFNTGLPFIDSIQTKFDLNILDWSILGTDGSYLLDQNDDYLLLPGSAPSELLANDDSDEIQQEASFVDWSVRNPFSEDIISEDEISNSTLEG